MTAFIATQPNFNNFVRRVKTHFFPRFRLSRDPHPHRTPYIACRMSGCGASGLLPLPLLVQSYLHGRLENSLPTTNQEPHGEEKSNRRARGGSKQSPRPYDIPPRPYDIREVTPRHRSYAVQWEWVCPLVRTLSPPCYTPSGRRRSTVWRNDICHTDSRLTTLRVFNGRVARRMVRRKPSA